LWKVPLEDLHVIDGFNVRVGTSEHREHVEALAKSISENGFYQSKPLAGYVALVSGKQVIYVTDGHCRLEATRKAIERGADIKVLPVVVSPKGTSMEDLTVALVISNNGKPLSLYETGLVCKRLVGYGWDEKEVAKRLGMQPPRVADLLDLVAAPKEVRSLVISGAVSASQAIETLKKHGENAGAKLKAGVDKAEKSGKKKATKKHIDDKPTCRAVVKELLAWAKVQVSMPDSTMEQIVKMAREASA